MPLTVQQKLSKKYPLFIYQKFDYEIYRNSLKIFFYFSIDGLKQFTTKIELPYISLPNKYVLNNLIFNLGMIEAISYWKLTCSPNFFIKCGTLSSPQANFWKTIFIKGLGEFFFINNINFKEQNFFNFKYKNKSYDFQKFSFDHFEEKKNLILIGGGKDSALTLYILSKASKNKHKNNILLLNPTHAAQDISKIMGYTSPIIIKRQIDPALIEMNQNGFLNGHTPFSAYLSFVSLIAASLNNYQNIITSNEKSANEENVLFYNEKINHQFSKSIEYEKLFRDYLNKYLTTDIDFFSFLRPLEEIQIAALFSQIKNFDGVFVSCNREKGLYWCGNCAKCAFSYLILRGFLDKDRAKKIFGEKDFLKNKQIQRYIFDLVGLGEYKPLECVGTTEESIMAVFLLLKKYKEEKLTTPDFLLNIAARLDLFRTVSFEKIKKRIINDWNSENFLPVEYKNILKTKLLTLNI